MLGAQFRFGPNRLRAGDQKKKLGESEKQLSGSSNRWLERLNDFL